MTTYTWTVQYRGGSRILSQRGTVKKIAPSGGRRENIWGILCQKSRFQGGARPLDPPLQQQRQCMLSALATKIQLHRIHQNKIMINTPSYSGMQSLLESILKWFFFFFFILFKMAFCFIYKIMIIIFCLLKVSFDGLTTLKSMA